MKHCPNDDCQHLLEYGRRAEFVAAADRCSDCGGSLEFGETPARHSVTEYRPLATVYETGDRIQAHVVSAAIQSAGIESHVSGDALQGAMGEIPLSMLTFRVQVDPEEAVQAREIALRCDDPRGGEGAA